MLKINDLVKDFSLPDANGKVHTLSSYLGKVVVIYFYPKNNTPGCNAQACSFNDEFDYFKENDIVVLGISKDSVESHSKFKNKFNLLFPTLSDESLEVIKYFGAYGEKRMFGKKYLGVKRMTYIINKEGVLTHIIPKASTKNSGKDIIKLLKEINA